VLDEALVALDEALVELEELEAVVLELDDALVEEELEAVVLELELDEALLEAVVEELEAVVLELDEALLEESVPDELLAADELGAPLDELLLLELLALELGVPPAPPVPAEELPPIPALPLELLALEVGAPPVAPVPAEEVVLAPPLFVPPGALLVPPEHATVISTLAGKRNRARLEGARR
jgi:hypothetical protein